MNFRERNVWLQKEVCKSIMVSSATNRTQSVVNAIRCITFTQEALEKRQQYNVTVVAFNENVDGPVSKSIAVWTHKDIKF